jgi:hypothetical protein
MFSDSFNDNNWKEGEECLEKNRPDNTSEDMLPEEWRLGCYAVRFV